MGNSPSNSSSSSSDNAANKEFIQSEIGKHDIVIFSKAYCPYCKETQSTIRTQFASADTKVFELDQMPNGSALQNTLAGMTGQRTVPNVFVKGQHLGGNDDTQAAVQSGRLAELLKTV